MSTGKFEALADSVFLAMRAWVTGVLDKRLAPIEKRIDDVRVIKGERGEAGPQGPAGEPGTAGAAGEAGAQGAAGQAGAQGQRGADGVDGAVGPKGDAGAPGEAGRDGADGAAGADGPQGRAGDPGAAGPPGLQGPAGDAGSAGEAGPQGEKGADGINGRDGAPGLRGDMGPQGERGAAGLNAFELAKASGFVGSEAEWLVSLRGTDGVRGIDGQSGQDGRDGRDGERGRDALEMDVLDGIDPARSYARGTAAVMDGGTWWAQRATDPVVDGDYRAAGWLCMLRGIADVEEAVEDGGRFILRTIRFSDGTAASMRSKTQMVINRGIFVSGKGYDAGDAVTYGGSSWIAHRDTTESPGRSDAWRLSVKSGKARV